MQHSTAQHSTVQCDPSLLAPAREEPAWAVKQSSGYSAEDQVRMGAPGAAQGMKQSSSTLDGQGKDKDSPPQDFQWIPTNLPTYGLLICLTSSVDLVHFPTLAQRNTALHCQDYSESHLYPLKIPLYPSSQAQAQPGPGPGLGLQVPTRAHDAVQMHFSRLSS